MIKQERLWPQWDRPTSMCTRTSLPLAGLQFPRFTPTLWGLGKSKGSFYPASLWWCHRESHRPRGRDRKGQGDADRDTPGPGQRPREPWEDLAERLVKIQEDRETETETESRRGTQRMSEETEEPRAWEERQVRQLLSPCRAPALSQCESCLRLGKLGQPPEASEGPAVSALQ